MTANPRILTALLAAMAALMAGPAVADYGLLNMTQGVTETSKSVYGLHMMIFWVCVAIGTVVFGAMIYSMINHRKSKGAKPANFHESTTAEIAWTIAPIIILVTMAVPATGVLLSMEDTSKADMSIKVTGIQWRWKYDYVEDGISFVSSLHPEHNEARLLGKGLSREDLEKKFGDTYLREVDEPLVIPVGKKIRFLLTAADVIHSWWVPALGWKKDAIPGFINEAWTKVDKPGIYRGKCAELCGKDHGFMPIVVKAVSQEDYAKWVAGKKGGAAKMVAAAKRTWTEPELLKQGEKVYKSTCASCHMANGKGIPGTFPALAGSAVATGDAAAHIDTVMNGRSGTAMAAYKAILSDVDLAAVITYERKSWGNNASAVQPADIKAAR